MRIIKDKIKNPKELKKIIEGLKKEKKRVVFTNGCFDILHYGHVSYLERAKKLADILIVAINSDNSVKRLKGKQRPVVKLQNRMNVLAALESVDFVTFFSQDTPLELIKFLEPHILVKGGDWNRNKIIARDVVESYGGKVVTMPYIKGQSTTKIIKKLQEVA